MKHAVTLVLVVQAFLLGVACFLHSGGIGAYVLLGCALLLAGAALLLHARSVGRECALIMQHLPGLEETRNRDGGNAPSQSSAAAFLPRLSESGVALYRTLDAQTASLAKALTRAEEAEKSAADLQTRLHTAEADKAQSTKTGEKMTADLQAVAGQTRTLSDELSKELRLLSKMVSEIGDNIESQRFSLHTTSDAMEHITSGVAEISSHAATASEDAQHSRHQALTGQAEVDGAVQGIRTVSAATDELMESMQLLGTKSENIGSVMAVIAEVADQTNLLALNAAIEAARAGEAGKGFAVVADEVRKLAEKTMQATGEIEGAVRDIQESARNSITAVEDAARHADESAERAGKAGELMNAVVQGMDKAAQGLESIAAATQEQAHSTGLTNTSLDQINQVAIDTAEGMQHFTSRLVSIQDKLDELEIIAGGLGSGKLETNLDNTRLVAWTPDLNTGLDLIDSQHKMLCAYINALHRASRRENSQDLVLDVVNCLKDYTAKHFSTEEQYFKHSAYPSTEQHMEVHRNFVNKVATVEAQLRHGQATVGDDLLRFLKDWLLNHIRVTDHQYIPFVKQFLAGSKLPERIKPRGGAR